MNLRHTSRRLAIAAALALPLAVGGASFAEPPMAPDAHGGGMHHPDPAAMADKHAQRLRDILQLRSDQEPALRALVDSMRPSEGMAPGDHHGPDGDAAMTTPQRLDHMLAEMDAHRAMMVRHIDAVKRFYAQLTPAQQKAFDALHGHGPMMMGHGMGGPHGMGPMGHRGMDGMDGPGMPSPDAPDGHSPG